VRHRKRPRCLFLRNESASHFFPLFSVFSFSPLFPHAPRVSRPRRSTGADDGTTAVVACVFGARPGELRCMLAWAGDSTALLRRADGAVVRLTTPHTAEQPEERARLLAAGGELRRGRALLRRGDGRHVSLAMTRAIGDFEEDDAPRGQSENALAPPTHPRALRPSAAVTAAPDVVWLSLSSRDAALILCSDGVTDVLRDAAVAAAAARRAPFAAEGAAAVVAAAAAAQRASVDAAVAAEAAAEDENNNASGGGGGAFAAAAAAAAAAVVDDATAVVVLLTEECEEEAVRLRMQLNAMANAVNV
jgi:serine/threonine protein phosphatase PrpC